MTLEDFEGFYYIENDPDEVTGFLKGGSISLDKDISNDLTNDKKITFRDVLEKFSVPVHLTCTVANVIHNLYMDNYGLEGTSNDLSLLNPDTINSWKKAFQIAYSIYRMRRYLGWTDGANNPADLALHMAMSGSNKTEDPNDPLKMIPNTIFEEFKILRDAQRLDLWYVKNLGREIRTYIVPGTQRIARMEFSCYDDSGIGGSFRNFVLWTNPEVFVTTQVNSRPYIYVYYTDDPDIERHEQEEVVAAMFRRIGPRYVKDHNVYMAPVYSSGEMQPFHIFTKGINWEGLTNPLDNANILHAIKQTILENDKDAHRGEDFLSEKYPTIFISSRRAIWPLYTNKSLNDYMETNPATSIKELFLSNPVSLETIQKEINDSSVLQNSEAQYPWKYEIFTLEHKWFPFIVGGPDGGLSDKIPKYRPSIDGNFRHDNTEDDFAFKFHTYLKNTINYICGDTKVIDSAIMSAMGYAETSTYVSFKLRGVEWAVYKRGNRTEFDLKV